MQFRYPPRVYVLMVMFCAMATGWSLLRLTRAATYEAEYAFDVQFRRLAPLRQALAGAPRAAYFSNVGDRGSTFTKLYGPTQYVLAPTLLTPLALDGESALVVGDFTRMDDYAAIGDELGLRVVAEFPMGAVLFERSAREPKPRADDDQNPVEVPAGEGAR